MNKKLSNIRDLCGPTGFEANFRSQPLELPFRWTIISFYRQRYCYVGVLSSRNCRWHATQWRYHHTSVMTPSKFVPILQCPNWSIRNTLMRHRRYVKRKMLHNCNHRSVNFSTFQQNTGKRFNENQYNLQAPPLMRCAWFGWAHAL